MAIVPDAQLIAFVVFGPCTPNSIAMLQLDAPPNTVERERRIHAAQPLREEDAELLLGVADAAERACPSSRRCARGPRARGRAPRPRSPCCAAATENWPKRSSRFARFASMIVARHRSRSTSAALWLRKIDGSKRVSVATADRSRAQRRPTVRSRPMPIGVIAPIPVTTTRRRSATRPPVRLLTWPAADARQPALRVRRESGERARLRCRARTPARSRVVAARSRSRPRAARPRRARCARASRRRRSAKLHSTSIPVVIPADVPEADRRRVRPPARAPASRDSHQVGQLHEAEGTVRATSRRCRRRRVRRSTKRTYR